MGRIPGASLLRQRGHMLSHRSPSTTTTHSLASQNLISSPQLFPSSACGTTQVRHATYVMRSRRAYEFTQLVQLSDGSTYTMRTTSPTGMYRSSKDTRNHIMWQPSEKSLRNVEVDEAGKLAAFRERFGRGWDLDGTVAADTNAAAVPKNANGAEELARKKEDSQGGKQASLAAQPAPAEPVPDAFDSLADLISGYASHDAAQGGGGISAKEQAKLEKSKGKKKK